MKNMFQYLLLLFGWTGATHAQQQKQPVIFPDIPGYHTLKCDFHMHTVFSDGHVWPNFRVYEAIRDGLDAIALTDHVDYEGHPEEIKKDYNRPYQIALEAAKNSQLIVIKGAEISPRMPPHHCNAIFVQDANAIPVRYMKDMQKTFVMKDSVSREDILAAFEAVKQQGAFISYNHPEFNWWDEKRFGRERFNDFHKLLLAKGMLHGIEVVNSGKYMPHAHAMALQYNLAMLANSDVHHDISNGYRDTHRPMTLVFAKERSAAGIREALDARRSAVYFRDYLAGRPAEMEALVKASVSVTAEQGKDKDAPALVLRLQNNSALPFAMQLSAPYMWVDLPLGRVTLAPHEVTTIKLQTAWDYPSKVKIHAIAENVLIAPDKALETDWELSCTWKR
jgi:hypothetical protein